VLGGTNALAKIDVAKLIALVGLTELLSREGNQQVLSR